MEVLFIQGPEKTSTSTITGILNCHPEVFILFENYIGQSIITKYGNQLLERYPDARHFFRSSEDYGKPVMDFFEYLKEKEPNHRYKHAGTKINSLDAGFTQKGKNHKVIFMMRDIRSWLIKESIIKYYRTDLDVVVPAVEYLRYILETTLYENSLRVRMEDLIQHNTDTINQLSEFMDLELFPHADKWWEKIGEWDESDPKSVFRLKHVHHSSRIKPGKLDSEVELKAHPFWEEASEIFDTYFRTGDTIHFSEEQVHKDLERVDNLLRFAPLPFTEYYEGVYSVRLGFSKAREIRYQSDKHKYGKKRGIKHRISRRLKNIMKAAID